MKVYETILTQTEAKKLSAQLVNTNITNTIQSFAEKEFETQFKQLCELVKEPIKVNRDGINSPFLKKIVAENKRFIAFFTSSQSLENNVSQPEREKQNDKLVKQKNTTSGD